jgi:hypothetical protein
VPGEIDPLGHPHRREGGVQAASGGATNVKTE